MASSDVVWRVLCWRQRRSKHARFALTDAAAARISGDKSFCGWRKEFERAARDSDRDAFLDEEELSSLVWLYQRKRGDAAADMASAAASCARFRFDPDGVEGHPSGERWAWRLSYSNRAVVVGPPEAPFPALYASRELDWTWRLENRNVLLTEVGRRPLASATTHFPEDADRHAVLADRHAAAVWQHLDATGDMVAVRVNGEVFYVDADDEIVTGAAEVVG